MPGTIHLLVGAAIYLLTQNLASAVPLALFSHYILDLLPHIDAETYRKKGAYSFTQQTAIALDGMCILLLFALIHISREDSFPILVTATVSQLPDLLMPVEKHPALYPLRAFHDMFHWDISRARYNTWFAAGLIIPFVVGATSLYVLLGAFTH